MRDRELIIDIDEQRYAIGRFSAEDGSWVLGRVLDSMRTAMLAAMRSIGDAPMPQGEADVEEVPPTPEQRCEEAVRCFITSGERKDIRDVQKLSLTVTRRLVGDEAQRVPLLMQDGRITDEGLATDFMLVSSLTAQALKFNLLPFFERGGMAAILQAVSRA